MMTSYQATNYSENRLNSNYEKKTRFAKNSKIR